MKETKRKNGARSIFLMMLSVSSGLAKMGGDLQIWRVLRDHPTVPGVQGGVVGFQVVKVQLVKVHLLGVLLTYVAYLGT